MAHRVKKHIHALHVLKTARPKVRRALLKEGDKDLIQCLCECCHNILNGHIKLLPKQKKLLQRHCKDLRALSSKRVKLGKKRQILVQKGGFLPAVLAPILTIASSLIGGLLS